MTEQVIEAATGLLERMSSTYRARNGREMGIQGEDGEKCWIVHSDDIEDLRRAVSTLQSSAALPSEAMVERLPSILPPAADVDERYLEGWVDAMVYAQGCLRATTPTAPVQDDDAGLVAEWIRLENAFHDALPDQGECGDPEAGKALCQFLYDNSEHIRSLLSPTQDDKCPTCRGTGEMRLVHSGLVSKEEQARCCYCNGTLSPTPDTGLIEAVASAVKGFEKHARHWRESAQRTKSLEDDVRADNADALADAMRTALANAVPAQVESGE